MRILTFIAILAAFSACQKDEPPAPDYGLSLPAVPFSYNNVNQIPGTGPSNELVTLGRVMFYDPRLSETNDVSCGSCHKQALGFADNLAFSKGVRNHSTVRNTMAIQNNSKGLFWDGRESQLKAMVLMPIYNKEEMGVTNTYAMTEELNQLPYYRDLVKKAFYYERISEKVISDALTAFVKSIQPNRSRFDQLLNRNPQMLSGEPIPPKSDILSDKEMTGLHLFVKKYNCNSCHNLQAKPGPVPMPVYSGPGGPGVELFVNIGLEEVPLDKGRRDVTGNPADDGKFRVPSLRNIALTAPYMHDGSLATLADVIDHYANGIKNTPNLDPKLLSYPGQPKTFEITPFEKEALIAFLMTLTDNDVVANPKWADPFTH